MTTPIVRLAGKDYPVPKLVPKQLKYVVPAIMESGSAMINLRGVNTETFIKLMTIVWWGVIWPNDPNRNDPTKNIKFDVLDEMPIGTDDIMDAVKVVQQQTGMYKKLPPYSVSWDTIVGAAREWRQQQQRPDVDELNPVTNEDLQGALHVLNAKSVLEADKLGEAQAASARAT